MAYARAGSPPQARPLPYPSSNSEKSYQKGKMSPAGRLYCGSFAFMDAHFFASGCSGGAPRAPLFYAGLKYFSQFKKELHPYWKGFS
jgi:hypothetical protein